MSKISNSFHFFVFSPVSMFIQILSQFFESLFFSSDSEDMYAGTGKGSLSRRQLCVAKMRIGYDKDSHMKFLKEYLTQQNKDDITEKPEFVIINGKFVD